ncbi:MAG TPA: PAS domain S-box protein [Gaiellaceae bacterium]|nr:PAS domain S-box protein [Gaiellaceae bacterium]
MAEDEFGRLGELAAIIDSSNDAIIGKRLDGTITSWNRAAEELYGYSAEEAVGRPIEMLAPPERRGEIADILLRLGAGERIERLQTVRMHKDGTRIDLVLTISPIRDEAGRVVGASTIAHDIREQLAAAAALRRSEEDYRHLFERHPAPMFVYDPVSLRFLAVNDAMVESYGWTREELLAMTIDELSPPEERESLRQDVAGIVADSVNSSVLRQVRKDGAELAVFVSGRGVPFEGRSARIVLAQDITRQRQLEEELRQTQKMDAIGRLAGGIAHDFNNLLVVIRGNSHLLLRHLEGEPRAYAEHIDAAAERASELTHQLLSFSRQRVLRLEPVDLNEVVTETLALLQRSLGEDIVITADLDPAVGAVLADRSELSNAILNLAINARDAMPDGGTLDIQSAPACVAEGETRGELPAGRYALLRITDSGVGMDEDTRTRAFDPFFTTKQEGTGLGLAAVYGVVRQSGGHIWVYSEPGLGTTFKLFFPLTGDAPAVAAGDVDTGTYGGNEVILVVEDTDMVRGLVASTLRSYGYEVIAVAGAAEALALVQADEPHVDLLLTDVIMPGLNGRELADRLLALRPGLKVLFTSGYPADTILRLGIAESSAAFIEKPFLPDELARTVRGVLDRSSEP